MIIDFNKNQVLTEDNGKKKFSEKVKDAATVAKSKFSEGAEWVKENPQAFAAILAGGTALFTGATKVVKGINKHVTAKQEQYNKERFIYDHSLGAYLETKRKLTRQDVVKINDIRRRTGKKLSEVLADMNLLK